VLGSNPRIFRLANEEVPINRNSNAENLFLRKNCRRFRRKAGTKGVGREPIFEVSYTIIRAP